MTGGKILSSNLPCFNEQRVELQVIVAEAAGDRRTAGKILRNERLHYVALKTILMIDDIVRNAKIVSDAASVIDVIDGAATTLDVLRHTWLPRQSALIPQLGR